MLWRLFDQLDKSYLLWLSKESSSWNELVFFSFLHTANRTLNSSSRVQCMSIHEKGKWTLCKAKEFLQEDKKWSDAIFKFCWIVGLLNTDSFINFCDKLNSETNTQANKSKRAHFWTDQCINFNEGPICLFRCVVCLRSSKYYLNDEVSFELNVRSSARARTPENKLSSWFQHELLRLNNYVYSM